MVENLHKVVIVGGGAGGLELATKLGDSLGKKNKLPSGLGILSVLVAIRPSSHKNGLVP